jgi:hypothetical protein
MTYVQESPIEMYTTSLRTVLSTNYCGAELFGGERRMETEKDTIKTNASREYKE